MIRVNITIRINRDIPEDINNRISSSISMLEWQEIWETSQIRATSKTTIMITISKKDIEGTIMDTDQCCLRKTTMREVLAKMLERDLLGKSTRF